MIQVKRVYDTPSADDGRRFLVDHLWPRGLTREAVKVKSWIKEVAPDNELRKWFRHDPRKWNEFRRRYSAQLAKKRGSWEPLLQAAHQGDITLVYSARDTQHNNAVVLKNYLEKKLKARRGKPQEGLKRRV